MHCFAPAVQRSLQVSTHAPPEHTVPPVHATGAESARQPSGPRVHVSTPALLHSEVPSSHLSTQQPAAAKQSGSAQSVFPSWSSSTEFPQTSFLTVT